jgi:hypothetical protein
MEPSDLAKLLSAPLTEGQKLKTDLLAHVAEQQSGLAKALDLEQRRTAALHGKGSDKARKLMALVSAHQESLAATNAASAGARARVPQPNAREFIIYGYVLSEEGVAVPKVNVSATDDKETIIQTAVTDADGSYALHVGGSEEPPDESAKSARPSATRRAAQSGGQKQQPTPPILRLLASDKKKTFLIRSQDTFTLELGKLAYQELRVPIRTSRDKS